MAITDKTVTIKALRNRGGIVSWCYDTPRQAKATWETICSAGRVPGTSEPLVNACYFKGEGLDPIKTWSNDPTESVLMRRGPKPIIDKRTGKPVTRETVAERFK